MIHVEPEDEPPRFHEQVRIPGERAIDELLGRAPRHPRTHGEAIAVISGITREEEIPPARFPSYWREALPDLMEKYHEICAYSCFRIHDVTGAQSTDHFAAKSLRWDRVYEWTNYRLCCARLNARKREFSDVLDPFEIETGWFVLELVGFQVLPNPALSPALRQTIDDTIERLGLDDALHRKARARDAERYWDRDISLRAFREESPFVAHELHRQGRLNPGDMW